MGPQGPKGDKGDTGEQGPKGDRGDKGNKGDAFTYDDFTPEQIEELQRPATEKAQEVANAEALRVNAEYERETAEQLRFDAEEDRVVAEQSRVEAEQQRAEEFAGFAQDIDRASKQYFIDLWNAAAGKYGCYNEATGFFELNGINDIPYAEAMEIYLHRATNRSSLSFQWGGEYKARTTIGIPCDSSRQNVALDNVVTMNKSIQVLRLAQPDFDEILTQSVTQFMSGTYVRRIVPIIRDNGVPKTSNDSLHWNAAFSNCARLEYVKISRL